MAHDHRGGTAFACYVPGACPGRVQGLILLDTLWHLPPGGTICLGCHWQGKPKYEPGLRIGDRQPETGRDSGGPSGEESLDRTLTL